MQQVTCDLGVHRITIGRRIKTFETAGRSTRKDEWRFKSVMEVDSSIHCHSLYASLPGGMQTIINNDISLPTCCSTNAMLCASSLQSSFSSTRTNRPEAFR